jgi:hypothetical protein
MVQSGAPSDNTTLLDVLRAFEDEGYEAQLAVTDDARVRCSVCRTESEPATMGFHALRRLEGASDPDDMMAVVALECPSCGAKGTAVLSFGPEASAAEAEVLLALDDSQP